MSRWDSLKPDFRPTVKKTKKYTENRAQDDRDKLDEGAAVSTTVTFEHCLLLRAGCLQQQQQHDSKSSDSDVALVISLAKAVQEIVTSKQLAPIYTNQVAESFVKDVFLPRLSSKNMSGEVSSSTAMSAPKSSHELQLVVLCTIQTLLQHANYASAIMAPLVEDVSPLDGKEQLRVNAIRLLLFQTLQELLLLEDAGCGHTDGLAAATASSREWTRVQTMTCQTLTIALQVAFQLEQTRRHSHAAELDVEPLTIQTFASKVLLKHLKPRGDSTTLSALQLVQAFLTRHPSAAPRIALSFLEDTTMKNESKDKAGNAQTDAPIPPCEHCGYSCKASLLNCWHISDLRGHADDQLIQSCAMDCTALMIRHLPLELWMKAHQSLQLRANGTSLSKYPCPPQNHRLLRSTLNFHDRASRMLEIVFKVTRCHLANRNLGNSRIQSLSSTKSLVVCILTTVPCQDDSLVLVAATKLVEALANLCNDFTDRAKRDMAVDLLIQASGGTVTPQGELLPMCFPLRAWLDTSNGNEFASKLLLDVRDEAYAASIWRFRLLRALFRSYPDFVTTNESLTASLTACVELVYSCNRNASSKGPCLEMLEGLLRGRADYPTSINDVLVDVAFIMPGILDSISDTNSSRTQVACASLGCLLPMDWEVLLGRDTDCLMLFQTMLDICSRDCGTKVKSVVYKSVGDMCLHFFDERLASHHKVLSEVLCKVLPVLCRAAQEETDASVKCMAFFALGNLAQALKDPAVPCMLENTTLEELVDCFRLGLADADERVASNSIRAVGHCYGLLVRSQCDGDSLPFQDILCCLEARINAACYTQDACCLELTWKQRSSVKKLAWGACNSLKVMLESNITDNRTLFQQVESCLVKLVHCLDHTSQAQEKVACCAASALRTVAWSALSHRLGDRTLIGRCITICASSLLSDDRSENKLSKELGLLLQHFLSQCSVADAAFALRQHSSAHIHVLFEWMVAVDAPHQHFKTISQALQQPGLQLEVDLERRFANRAAAVISNIYDDEEEL